MERLRREVARYPAGSGSRQQTLDLAHDTSDLILIRKRDHEELVTLMKTDDAVGKQPDAVEEGIAAEQPTYRRAGNRTGLNDLRKHRRACGATERAEQRRADVFRHLALKFNSLALGFG